MITIRIADAADAPAISRLLISVAQKQVAHEFPQEGAEALLGGMQPGAIAKVMLRGYRYHLAFADDRLVGAIGMRGYSHIYHLFVAQQAQGGGIGRQLWVQARQTAECEIRPPEYTVFSSRYAEKFYQALGFRRTGADQTRRGVTGVPMTLIKNNKEMK